MYLMCLLYIMLYNYPIYFQLISKITETIFRKQRSLSHPLIEYKPGQLQNTDLPSTILIGNIFLVYNNIIYEYINLFFVRNY